MKLSVQPVRWKDAKAFVRDFHRTHKPPVSHLFSIGLDREGEFVGVIIVGRPCRELDDGFTAEATRCCVMEGVPNGCSKLYAHAWRAARAMGYRRLITYTLKSEPGTSLIAAGWVEVYTTRERPNGWDTPSRPREVQHTEAKRLWEAA